MKKIKIYGWIILVLGFVFTACSNLDDSSFIPQKIDGTIIYSEPFSSSLGQFTVKNVLGNQVWTESSNSYAGVTGYVNSTNNANEDWLISPEIDLKTISASNLSFDYVLYKGNFTTDATVWVSDNYVNDSLPAAANWTQLNVKITPDAGKYVFANSGELSLSIFAGKKVRIAFKYLSTGASAGTMEVKNFLIKSGEAKADTSLIFSEPLASSLGRFTTQSVSGNETWSYSNLYICMAISGYSAGNKVNEDWLISPEIDLSNLSSAYFSFDHAGKFFVNPNYEATAWISTNYIDGLPSTAIWTQINILNYFKDFTFVTSGKLSLNDYIGKKIHIAFKYVSSSSAAGNWELRNFNVYEGMAGGVESLPLHISDACAYQSGGNAWVEGYIVGYSLPFKSQYAYVFNSDTCSQMSNILIADTISSPYVSRCLAVHLPRGSMRNALNLKLNKALVGQKVKLYGTLSPNMGVAGLVNPTNYILSNGTSGNSSTTKFFSETFATSLGQFSSTSNIGVQTWKWQSGFGASMSGYSGSSIENED